ncbi:MAG TPA: ZIP family metal transporter, partial [Longimicrobiales bacterium]|nr:ZIP family metal transporter [Longimicrobiales bacterium]
RGGLGHVTAVTGFDPALTVLVYSALAALAAGLGALPGLFRRRPPAAVLGLANALASGLMIGVAYMLLTVGLVEGAPQGAVGALLGVFFVRATHAITGTGELDRDDPGPEHGYRVILLDTLHAAHEGVAIGIAMLISLPFGIAMALALAVHNIPEAVVLTEMLGSRGLRVHQAGGLAIAVNLNQVLLAVTTFAVVGAAPILFPWVVGFAVGALLYLVLVELLPVSYQQAGSTGIALVTVVAMVMVVLLADAQA